MPGAAKIGRSLALLMVSILLLAGAVDLFADDAGPSTAATSSGPT
jgi:hypothetical protein